MFKSLNNPIAFIDSGIGGLSLLSECITRYPAHYIYIADTKYMPYGNKSTEFLLKRRSILTSFAQSQHSSSVVYACNTLCTLNQPIVSSSSFKNIIITDQLINNALKQTNNNRIGIIGTSQTINSNYFLNAITYHSNKTFVYQSACPILAEAIEQQSDADVLKELIKHYLDPVLKEEVDTLILACTHYPLIKDMFKHIVPGLNIICNDATIIKDVYFPAIKASSITVYTSGDSKQLINALTHYVPRLVPFVETIISIDI